MKNKQTNKRLISLLRIEMTKQQRKLTFLLKVSFPLPSETQFFSICVSGCMLSYLQTLLLDPCAVWCRNQSAFAIYLHFTDPLFIFNTRGMTGSLIISGSAVSTRMYIFLVKTIDYIYTYI